MGKMGNPQVELLQLFDMLRYMVTHQVGAGDRVIYIPHPAGAPETRTGAGVPVGEVWKIDALHMMPLDSAWNSKSISCNFVVGLKRASPYREGKIQTNESASWLETTEMPFSLANSESAVSHHWPNVRTQAAVGDRMISSQPFPLYLVEGEYIKCQAFACLANDIIHVQCIGMKFKVRRRV